MSGRALLPAFAFAAALLHSAGFDRDDRCLRLMLLPRLSRHAWLRYQNRHQTRPSKGNGLICILWLRPGPHPRPLARGPTPARRAGLRPAASQQQPDG